ncbi:hypothetical protein B5F07_10840 [Lachnoclostridium sp. An169]|nr:hypothetical protein B5F07_10840 [Lachnoclostridium sp. An169]
MYSTSVVPHICQHFLYTGFPTCSIILNKKWDFNIPSEPVMTFRLSGYGTVANFLLFSGMLWKDADGIPGITEINRT